VIASSTVSAVTPTDVNPNGYQNTPRTSAIHIDQIASQPDAGRRAAGRGSRRPRSPIIPPSPAPAAASRTSVTSVTRE
jgi:hypothetical protein